MLKNIDTPFWLMIAVISSQIAAGLLVDHLWGMGIGMPITVVGTVMIISLCTIKLLALFGLPARWRERRLQRAAEAKGAEARPAAAGHIEHKPE